MQSAYTSYVPKSLPFEISNSSAESESQNLISVNANPVDELKVEPEMVRVVQYRPGTNTLGIVIFCLTFGTVSERNLFAKAIWKFFFSTGRGIVARVQCV